MSEIRGAAAPTSGASEGVGADEAELDRAVREVAAYATSWVAVEPLERAALLGRVVEDTAAVAEEWLAAACAAKGYDPDSPEGGEELFSGIGTFVRMAQAFRRTMTDLARYGRPRYPGPVTHRAGGRVAIGVMPSSFFDRILYTGVTGEVWMEPGVDEDEVRATQAGAYRDPHAAAGVALVLGAGNVASLGPRDVLSQLFADNKVVVLKANPVNDYLVPYWERAMAALIERGVLRVVRGGAAAGVYLTRHPLVTDVHVTGSDKTFDAIVFGAGPDGARRKAADEPIVTKPVSGELGNVSPVVVVPGRWSAKEIDYQARHVATMITNNAGFNCLTPRVVVTHAEWPQREEFLDALEAVLASLAPRRAYYPGADERRSAFLAAHPDADVLGAPTPGTTPWTLVRGVDPADHADVAFNVEAFCAWCAETALPATSTVEFLRAATSFCNDVLWGTLSMTLLVDPRTLKDPLIGPAVDEAVAALRYGSIGVNLWHALSFALGSTAWGAYPGHATTDIQSGRGFVGNAYLFSRPEKSVVRGPFVATPSPAWFATNRHGAEVMRRLLSFEVRPSWLKLPGLLVAALKG